MSRALDLLRGLVVDDAGHRWGETAEPWQRADVCALLDADPQAPRRHFITRPKDGRKTADMAAVHLAFLLEQMPRDGKSYALASDREQVGLLLDSMRGYQQRTPGLAGAFAVYENKVTTTRGSQLEALPADAASAQGIRGYLITADELHEWLDTRPTRRLWQNVVQGLEKSLPDGSLPRFAAITNAGSPQSLAGRARKVAVGSKHWRLSETPGPLRWKTLSQLEALRESCETDAEFERLHLNVWAEGPDRLASLEDIEACATLGGPLVPTPGLRYAIGVDLSLSRDLSAAAVCHTEASEERWVDGRLQVIGRRVVVDRLEVWRAPRGGRVDLGEIEMWLDSVARAYGAKVVMESYQAAPIQQGLLRRGIEAELLQPTAASNSRQVVLLMSLLHDRAISLPDDADLIAELANTPIVESQPNVYKLGDQRVAGLGHHDRTSALGIAVHELMAGSMSDLPVRRVLVKRTSTGWVPFGSEQPSPEAQLLSKLARAGDPRASALLSAPSPAGRWANVPCRR